MLAFKRSSVCVNFNYYFWSCKKPLIVAKGLLKNNYQTKQKKSKEESHIQNTNVVVMCCADLYLSDIDCPPQSNHCWEHTVNGRISLCLEKEKKKI